MTNRQSLPRPAADKLAALSSAADDARTLAASTAQRASELQGQMGYFANQPEQLAGAEHEISRLRAAQQQHKNRHDVLSTVVNGIARWLQTLPSDAVLEMAKPPKSVRREGEDVARTIERVRMEIAEAMDELQAVKAAPIPKAAMKEAAARYIESLAEQGRPHIKCEGDRFSVDFNDPHAYAPAGPNRMAALFAWWDRGWMVKRLHAEIDALPEPRLALSASEKQERFAELSADLDKLERTEEALIEAAHAEGREIARRPTASPAAVLGVRMVKRQRERVRAA